MFWKQQKRIFSICQTTLIRPQTNQEICFMSCSTWSCVLLLKRFVVLASAHAFHHSCWDFSRRYSLALDRCRCFFFIVEQTSPISFSVVWIVTGILSNLVHNKVPKTRLKLKLFAFLAGFRCFLRQVLTR